MDHRPEEDGRGEKGGGKVAGPQAGRDDISGGRDVRRDCGWQDDWAKGVHDRETQDKGKHDARDKTRWPPQGMHTMPPLLLCYANEILLSEYEGQDEALIVGLPRQT